MNMEEGYRLYHSLPSHSLNEILGFFGKPRGRIYKMYHIFPYRGKGSQWTYVYVNKTRLIWVTYTHPSIRGFKICKVP